MNILFATPEYPGINVSGGLGAYVRNISEALVQRGHQATVITPVKHGKAIQEIRNGVRIEAPVIPQFKGKAYLSQYRFLWRFKFDFPLTRKAFHDSSEINKVLRNYVANNLVDVLHFSEFAGLGFHWALGRKMVPHVIRLSSPTRYAREFNGMPLNYDVWMLNHLEMFPIRSCSAVYAPTRANLEYVSRWVPRCSKQGLVIPSPVDTIRFSPASGLRPKASRVLLAGRVDILKGALLVANAITMLFDQCAQVCIRWVGEDSTTSPSGRSMVEWIRSQIPYQHRARFEWNPAVGFDEMPTMYRQSDIFWVPSVRDNLPNTGLEAMASGLPVIASCRSGLEEIIKDGKTGMIFQSGNAKDLCSKTLQVMGNQQLCTKLGVEARSYAIENLSYNVASEKVEHLLLSCIHLKGTH